MRLGRKHDVPANDNTKGNTMRRLVIAAFLTATSLTPVGAADPDHIRFDLQPNPAFKACVGDHPHATVRVVRGNLNDRLTIKLSGIKPGLKFDLFTVQRSNLNSNGNVLASFPGVGLAWYQSDLDADDNGNGEATIRTILLDQIFGFDADKKPDGTTTLPPTNTFHVGFWFNDPNDAAPCGFDVSKPTPFNGEHMAGPLAMISTPVQPAGLGPLCTKPTGVTEDDNAKDPTKLLCNP